MQKKDIITCPKKIKKNYKNIKKFIVRLKTCFTNANMSIKVCYKDIFACSFIIF